MKHKVSELEGALLDAAVAKAEGDRLPNYWLDPDDGTPWLRPGREEWHPSARWEQGGPIIDREEIHLGGYGTNRQAEIRDDSKHWVSMWGETLLIAAMRTYVAWKLGEEVELPC